MNGGSTVIKLKKYISRKKIEESGPLIKIRMGIYKIDLA